ncbi:MAG TPA: exodeoxyribonuclease VII large subunit, partial [Thermoplasmatales archaeon]|nr:exodeoxyribonuclease VII large subunit [Thermoplasmatales archaeon]
MLKKKILTVKELSEHIKGLLEAEELAGIWVEGELSNFRKAVRHYYFDLKDEHALLRCVMFRPSIPFVPKNG